MEPKGCRRNERLPRGVEHRTAAQTETTLMMIEPQGVLNTGHEGGERTALNDVWI